MSLRNFHLFFTHDVSSKDQFHIYLLPIIGGEVTKPRQSETFNKFRLHRKRDLNIFPIPSNKHTCLMPQNFKGQHFSLPLAAINNIFAKN